MSSTYDLVEEDFIHETSLSTSNIQDKENSIDNKGLQDREKYRKLGFTGSKYRELGCTG